MSKQGKINFALGQTKTPMLRFTVKGDNSKLWGLRMVPFAIPWLITLSLVQNDSLLTGTLHLCLSQTFEETALRRQKWRADIESHLLAALRGHLREQRGEETGVLEQDTAHDSKVSGHHHGVSLYNTHTHRHTRNVNTQSHIGLQIYKHAPMLLYKAKVIKHDKGKEDVSTDTA